MRINTFIVKGVAVFISLFVGINGFSQSFGGYNLPKDTTDYLSYKYKYLDKEFAIKVDSAEFTAACYKYTFNPNPVTYSDSLIVVMMMEFNESAKARNARRNILFSWLDLSYYTWESEDGIKSLAKSVGVAHPYRMYTYLSDEANKNPKVDKFYSKIKAKLAKNNSQATLDNLSRRGLLTLAFRQNPERYRDIEEHRPQARKERIRHMLTATCDTTINVYDGDTLISVRRSTPQTTDSSAYIPPVVKIERWFPKHLEFTPELLRLAYINDNEAFKAVSEIYLRALNRAMLNGWVNSNNTVLISDSPKNMNISPELYKLVKRVFDDYNKLVELAINENLDYVVNPFWNNPQYQERWAMKEVLELYNQVNKQ